MLLFLSKLNLVSVYIKKPQNTTSNLHFLKALSYFFFGIINLQLYDEHYELFLNKLKILFFHKKSGNPKPRQGAMTS